MAKKYMESEVNRLISSPAFQDLSKEEISKLYFCQNDEKVE